MNVELIIFTLIILIFIVGLSFLAKYAPAFIIKLRARLLGLELTLNEAKICQRHFCAKKEFLTGVREIWKFKKITIERLAMHYLAGGNLVNVKEGLIELNKRTMNTDLTVLLAVDLANKNLKEEIEKAENVEIVEFSLSTKGNTRLDYKGKYKLSFPNSIWMESNNEEIHKAIKHKLEVFLKSWEINDRYKTESFIRENILTIDFWEKEFKVVLLNQEIYYVNYS